MPSALAAARTRSHADLLIAFVDLTRFKFECQRRDDDEIANTLDTYYQLVTDAVNLARGRVIKFIGDAALIVFKAEDTDRGIHALMQLRKDVDSAMADNGWECRLHVRAHAGNVVAGDFGGAAPFYDVIGRAVNEAAMLPQGEFVLSTAAFDRLSAELRQRVAALGGTGNGE